MNGMGVKRSETTRQLMTTFKGWRITNWCCPLVATEPTEQNEPPVLCLVTGPETSVEFPLVAVMITFYQIIQKLCLRKIINFFTETVSLHTNHTSLALRIHS